MSVLGAAPKKLQQAKKASSTFMSKKQKCFDKQYVISWYL